MSELDFGPKAGIGDRGEGLPLRSPLADPGPERGEDELDRSLRPKTLEEFVGQERLREQLRVFIDAAKGREEATRIMLHVHHKGVGVCGVYTYEVAETKVAQVVDFARQHQHPLQCTMEKE